ncbi:alpha/beta hydrolase [Nocardia thraciensis]
MREYRTGGQGWRAALIRGLCRVFVRPTLSWWPLRGVLAPCMALVDMVHRPVPRLRGTVLQRVDGGHWCGEVVRPRAGVTGGGAIVYFHGGAFVFCGLATHRRIVERLALRTGLPVLSVGYRQHPVGRLDASMDDAAAAVRWLHDAGIGTGSTVFVGDSAGGYLAFQLALEAERRGIDRPAGVVGLAPLLELDPAAKLRHANAGSDVFLPARRFAEVAAVMAGDESGAVDPQRSPVNGPVAALPPVLLICAEDEVLRADAELMADRLDGTTVPYTLQIWQGQVHAFPVLGHLLPESRAALDEIADFVAGVQGRRSAAAG